jgi:hypothetical protein
MLEVIGEALKMRLCLTDMTFERECEEEDKDANKQFQNLKEANQALIYQLSELNGALLQICKETNQKNSNRLSKIKKN